MSARERYAQNPTKAHYIVAGFLALSGIASVYHVSRIQADVAAFQEVVFSAPDFAGVLVLPLAAIPLYLQWLWRKTRRVLLTKQLIAIAVVCFAVLATGHFKASDYYVPYLQGQGYRKCTEYDSGSNLSRTGSVRHMEVWRPEGQCDTLKN